VFVFLKLPPAVCTIPEVLMGGRAKLGAGLEFYCGNRGIAVEGEQNAVDHCGNYSNFLPTIVFIFILFTHVHYYFDT
jgi:hypothetical protein